MALSSFSRLLAGFGGDTLEALAALADHHGLVAVALDHDGGGNAHEAAELGAGLLLELIDDHGGGIGQARRP